MVVLTPAVRFMVAVCGRPSGLPGSSCLGLRTRTQLPPNSFRSERLNAVLKYLNLMACTSLPDYAENDINTVTNIARVLLQDVSDVFRVIEQRGFDTPDA